MELKLLMMLEFKMLKVPELEYANDDRAEREDLGLQ